MKKIVATISTLALAMGLAVAGPIADKNPPIVDVCDCYPPGFQLGAHVGGIFFDGAPEDAVGGGINLAYFFTDRLGLEISYSAFGSDPDALHLYTGDLIYRLFINDDTCFAPYLIAGGGGLSNGDTAGVGRLGAGLEWRFEGANCWGIFADGTYNWIGDDKYDDAAVARLGVRIPW